MFDPFLASDPPVLVHEVDGPDFEAVWTQAKSESDDATCPICGRRGVAEHGVAPSSQRPWIRFACGDVVAQEITAG